MPRDPELVQERDAELLQHRAKLQQLIVPVRYAGKQIDIRLSVEQIHQMLGKMYHLSTRRIEDIIYPVTASRKAPV